MLATTATRRGLALTAVAAAALLTASACGSASQQTPTESFGSGAASLYAGNQLTVSFKVDATAAQLVALSGPDDPLTTAQAQLISGGDITVAATSAGSSFAADLKAGSSSQAGEKFALTVDSSTDKDLFQLVYADKTIYARANVKALAGYAGKSAEVQQFADSGQIPAQESFIADAIAGKWLKLDAASLLAQSSPSVAPSRAAALRSALVGVFVKDVTVTRDAKDSSHLILTGDSHTVATDLLAAVKQDLSSVPGATQLFGKLDAAKVPSKQVAVDAYVRDGTLTSLKLNLTPFLSATDAAAVKGAPVDLELDFTKSATVTPPATATAVPLEALSGLLGAAGAGV